MGLKKLLKKAFSDPPEDWFARFNKEYSRKKSIVDIPPAMLDEWGAKTRKTKGHLIATFVNVDAWGHSAKSLFTAANLVRVTVPELVASDEGVRKLVLRLERAGLRTMKQDYETRHGKIADRLTRNSAPH